MLPKKRIINNTKFPISRQINPFLYIVVLEEDIPIRVEKNLETEKIGWREIVLIPIHKVFDSIVQKEKIMHLNYLLLFDRHFHK